MGRNEIKIQKDTEKSLYAFMVISAVFSAAVLIFLTASTGTGIVWIYLLCLLPLSL